MFTSVHLLKINNDVDTVAEKLYTQGYHVCIEMT